VSGARPRLLPDPEPPDTSWSPGVEHVAELSSEIAALRPQLLKLARLQLRNDSWADDAVSETLLAALEQSATFAARSGLKTWVIGILKHKIVDQLRRNGREMSIDAELDSGAVDSIDALYAASGARVTPAQDWGDPETLLARRQFFDMLQLCLEALPGSLGRVFLMREWLELETEEICTQLGISVSNCHVMLFRARVRLRECVEAKWMTARAA
jgi:RNA polymerase sigma-70 factor (ECF subfamily)